MTPRPTADDQRKSRQPAKAELQTNSTTSGIVTITIDRPHRRNALTVELLAALASEVESAAGQNGTRVVVLTGVGTSFSGGSDLRAHAEPTAWSRTYAHAIGAIEAASVPVVARVNGHAFGGALGLVAACDYVVVVDSARLCYAEARYGTVPTLAAAPALRRLRPADASDLFLRGREFDGKEAAALGLANRSVPAGDLDDAVTEYVADILQCGPEAVGTIKMMLRTLPTLKPAESPIWLHNLTEQVAASAEAAEGRAAFAAHRPPKWIDMKGTR